MQSVPESAYPEITALWEASVRATHHFLKEEDIQFFRPLILNEYLYAVKLTCSLDKEGKINGFAGTLDGKLEMLFIHPEARGSGIGKKLLLYTIEQLKIKKVEVNEANEQAVGFYLHMGFSQTGRSELDGSGKPFPLLHLELPG